VDVAKMKIIPFLADISRIKDEKSSASPKQFKKNFAAMFSIRYWSVDYANGRHTCDVRYSPESRHRRTPS